MSISSGFIRVVKQVLPSPFTIAIFITLLTTVLALLLTENNNPDQLQIINIGQYWQKGFWELLAFTMQMMLILILGHVLAISGPIAKIIESLISFGKNTASAAFIVALSTLIMAYLNWGLGLIFGAILARKIGDAAARDGRELNYPLIGAAGYAGLMVWHGGISGSAPLTISGSEHSLIEQIGVIGINETVFSSMNLVAIALTLLIIPATLYYLGAKSKTATDLSFLLLQPEQQVVEEQHQGAERLDHSPLLSVLVGGSILLISLYQAVTNGVFSLFSLNQINFLLFGFGLLFHGSIAKFVAACEVAIKGGTGIMIQFPLYAGIMGIMKYSGLIYIFSNFFVDISTSTTFPIFTFISAAIVNVFVPSGGGQWAVQGPIIVEAAQQLNVSLPKSVMALAYGDQITNMLQPFWALPLLGITKLKAKEILPYTMLLMLVGIIIFVGVLLIF